ncbi:hypothetical protein ACFXBB_37905 [Streptomyces scopuliridis]|uniref:hypothetical protein n=1 Tax=Streptomyces scopuliridis TaxID=452529 RepID=UPI0036B16D67
MELRARLQPFQDRYDQAVRDGNAARLNDGHETSMEEPHWGHNSEGQPIAWVGSAPDDW